MRMCMILSRYQQVRVLLGKMKWITCSFSLAIILTNRANSSSPKESANESEAFIPRFVIEAGNGIGWNWLKKRLGRAKKSKGACPQTPLLSVCFTRTLYTFIFQDVVNGFSTFYLEIINHAEFMDSPFVTKFKLKVLKFTIRIKALNTKHIGITLKRGLPSML